MNNQWFAVAVVESVFLAIVLFSKTKIRFPKKIKGRIGIVKRIEFVYKGIADSPVAVLQIKEPSGIFFATIDKNKINFSSGDKIEFWPSLQNAINQIIFRIRYNKDGTIEYWQEEIRYMRIKKYRVVERCRRAKGIY